MLNKNDTFIKSFEEETIGTIKAITGELIEFKLKEIQEITIISSIVVPIVNINFIVPSTNAKLMLSFNLDSCILLSSMMMGEEFEERKIEQDNLDAIQEIAKNIIYSINSLFNINLEFDSIEVIPKGETCSIDSYSSLCIYNFGYKDFKSLMLLNLNKELEDIILENSKSSKSLGYLNNNLGIIGDVKVRVSIRIGKKKMLLRDLTRMDIGDSFELDQLANEPLDILVEDKVIGIGEIVVVDSNFGIQIKRLHHEK